MKKGRDGCVPYFVLESETSLKKNVSGQLEGKEGGKEGESESKDKKSKKKKKKVVFYDVLSIPSVEA